MGDQPKKKRPRRQFSDEFMAGAVRLVLEEGKSVSQVARDLDLTTSALRTWVERARADKGKSKTGTQKRRRSSLGYATPAEYERAASERQVA